jgi:hypothetical protein
MAGCAIFPWLAPGSRPLLPRQAARHPVFEKYRTCAPCRFPRGTFYDVIARRVFLVENENCSKQHTRSPGDLFDLRNP